MEFENKTNFPSELMRTTWDENEMLASVICRVTWDWKERGHSREAKMVVSEEQSWPIFSEPTETEEGQFEADHVIAPEGVDLMIFGHAWSPVKERTSEMEIKVKGPQFEKSFLIFGQRFWRKKFLSFDLEPTKPEPFENVTLGFENAYGGKSEWDGLEMPFQMNPEGKGYFREKKQALGGALPQIEMPDEVIHKWNDQPTPACTTMCAMSSGLRMKNAVDVEENGEYKIKKNLFNIALPYMTLPKVEAEDEFLLEGFSPDGLLTFKVPGVHLLAEVSFDEERFERTLSLDQLALFPDQKQAFARYRYSFRYPLYERQIRACELRVKGEFQ